MDFSTICRTCLGSNNLNPIFNNIDECKRYSGAIFLTTGIKVGIDDGLPQNMCVSCIYFLNNSLKFRKRSKDVENELIRLKNVNNSMVNNILNVESAVPDIKLSEDCLVVTEASETKLINYERKQDLVKIHIQDKFMQDIKADNCNIIETNSVIDEDDTPLKYLIDNTYETTIGAQDVKLRGNAKRKKVNLRQNITNTEIDLPYEEVYSTDTNKNRVKCKLCQKVLSKRSIDSHIDRCHPGADGRKVKCDLCDNYILKNKLNRHKVMMHGSEQFKCGYCKTEFDNRETLVDHVTTCTAKKKKRNTNESGKVMTECDVCHKAMQKASLRMHKAIKHAGLGPVCEHCGRRFGNKFRLQEHRRAKHGYDKFRCSSCHFQSASTLAMRNHERRHRGEKPFACEQCDAKFHAAYLLAQHRQSHRTEKLAKCDECPASFKANNSLHMHKLTCHSRRVWRCGECGRAYSCRHYALRHLRLRHRLAEAT